MAIQNSYLFRSLLRIVLGVIIGVPLLLYPMLFIAQDEMIFPRVQETAEDSKRVKLLFPSIKEIKLTVDDGVTLHGWLLPGQADAPAPLVIFFGGQGALASDALFLAKKFNGWSFLAVDYRGHGLSTGSPSEKNLIADAVAVYDYVRSRSEINPARIATMGYSLGTGVAVGLAEQRPLRGVILEAPYDSLQNVIQARYPIVPVGLFLRHPFNSMDRAKQIKSPLLALIGGVDDTVSLESGMNLVRAWAGPSSHHIFPKANHGDISTEEKAWILVREFLEKEASNMR